MLTQKRLAKRLLLLEETMKKSLPKRVNYYENKGFYAEKVTRKSKNRSKITKSSFLLGICLLYCKATVDIG